MIRFEAMPFAHSETPEHIRATLGAILRRHRDARPLADVAGPAGISTAYLCEVERGRKDISTERLLSVARALEVTVADLYLELAHELGAREPLALEWNEHPRAQLRRMTERLGYDQLRAAARFTTFLAMTEGTPPKRPIGFLR
jgi:transcriptional regulator with XRE-family HTH domain